MNPLPVTQIERGMAAAIHIISIPAPIWGPFFAWLWQRKQSQFVAKHAWQALMEAIILKAALLLLSVISLTVGAVRLYGYWQNDWVGFRWEEFVLRSLAIFLLTFLVAAVTTVLSVFQAWRAWNGRWPRGKAPSLPAAPGSPSIPDQSAPRQP